MSYLFREMRRVLYTIAVLLLGATSVSAGSLQGNGKFVGTMKADRILFLGNSITTHGALPGSGWSGEGWGMAASAKDKDYVHLLLKRFTEAAGGKAPEVMIENIAGFEVAYDTYDVFAGLKTCAEFKADIVILAIGENVPALSSEQAQMQYRDGLKRLFALLQKDNSPSVFARSSFFSENTKDDILRQVCTEVGGTYVDISDLCKDESNYARSEHTFENTAVGIHPGDRGMASIAEAIWNAVGGSAQGNAIVAENLPDLAMSSADSVAHNKDLAIAKTFPKVNEPVRITLTVRNIGTAESGESTLLIADGVAFSSQQVVPGIPPQGSTDVTFQYTPSTTGTVPLSFTLDQANAVTEINESNNSANVQIPVVTNDLYVLWYGDVQDLKYANIPMRTSATQGSTWIAEWKRRGAYAATYATPSRTLEVLMPYYSSMLDQGFDVLAIDELGYTKPGTTPAWMDAFAAIKQSYPNCFIAVWYIGVLDSQMVQMVTSGKVDLLVFEIYLGRDDPKWADKIDYYIKQAKDAGILDRCICGLATDMDMNNRRKNSVGLTAQQHADFIEEQIAHIRTKAPEMPGVGFFTARTLPGERALIDDICRRYFVK